MEKLILYINGNEIIVQQADYIEHGWRVVIRGRLNYLYEIPYGGGDEIFVSIYDTLLNAIKAGESLT